MRDHTKLMDTVPTPNQHQRPYQADGYSPNSQPASETIPNWWIQSQLPTSIRDLTKLMDTVPTPNQHQRPYQTDGYSPNSQPASETLPSWWIQFQPTYQNLYIIHMQDCVRLYINISGILLCYGWKRMSHKRDRVETQTDRNLDEDFYCWTKLHVISRHETTTLTHIWPHSMILS